MKFRGTPDVWLTEPEKDYVGGAEQPQRDAYVTRWCSEALVVATNHTPADHEMSNPSKQNYTARGR